MNKHVTTATLALALLLLAMPALAGAPPEVRNDFGDAQFGFEPNPPKIPALPELDASDLGAIRVIEAKNVEAGDAFAGTIGGAAVLAKVTATRGLDLTLARDQQLRTVSLPPIPSTESLDFRLIVTPLTTSVDRAGNNQAVTKPNEPNVSPQQVDVSKVRDATVVNAGMLDGLDASTFSAPSGSNVTSRKVNLVPDVSPDVGTFIIDPEAKLEVIQRSDQLSAAELAKLTATPKLESSSAIKTALNSITVQALTINGVLDALKGSSLDVGAVDLQGVSDGLALDGVAVQSIGDGTLPEKVQLDLRNPAEPVLAFYNGGTGKLVLSRTNMNFDAEKVLELKPNDSVANTDFFLLNAEKYHFDQPSTPEVESTQLARYNVGKLSTAPEVGAYDTLLDGYQPALVRGFEVNVLATDDDVGPKAVDYTRKHDITGAYDVRAPIETTSPTLVLTTAARSLVMTDGAAELLRVGSDCNPSSANLCGNHPAIMPPDPDVPMDVDEKPRYHVVLPDGDVSQFFKADDFELPESPVEDKDYFAVLSQVVVEPVNLKEYGNFAINTDGLAHVEDVAVPDIRRPTIDTPRTGFAFDLSDALYEHWQPFVLPELAPIVPTSVAESVVSTAANAQGTGMSFIPYDQVAQLPIGQMTEYRARFVGEKGSLHSAKGISGVTGTLIATDPLGLGHQTTVKQSNTAGYAVFALPSFGSFSLNGTHAKYDSVFGSGSASGPGTVQGHEYTMSSKSGNTAKDFAYDNSSYLGLALVGLAGAGIWWLRRGG